MKRETIEICGETFEKSSSHFSFEFQYGKVYDMEELEKLKELTRLESASFNSTNFDDIGLKHVARYCKYLKNLNLQDTQISDNGVKYLSRLKNLEILRLKENSQLTNKCISGLNLLQSLTDLQIHETSINYRGIEKLSLQNLRNLIVDKGDLGDFNSLLDLSQRLTQCTILVKGEAQILNGKIINFNK